MPDSRKNIEEKVSFELEKLRKRVKALENNLVKSRKNEEKLLEKVERFSILSNAAFDAIAIHDKGRLIQANDRFYDMFGYEPSELLHKQVIHRVVAPEARTDMKNKIANRTQTPYESTGVRKDGTKFPIQLRVKEIDYQGQHLRVGSIEDITDRKLTEDRLRGSEIKYRSLFDNMLDGLAYHKIVTDKKNNPIDYIFLEVNHAFERMLGLENENIIGKKVTEVIPGIEKDPADWIGIYGKVAMGGGDIVFEQYAEPLKRWFSVSCYSLKPGYFIAVFHDITVSKHAEEEEKRLNRQLQEKNRELEQLLYIFLHDFRSPLVNIRGFSDELTNSINAILTMIKGAEIPGSIRKKIEPIVEKEIPEDLSYILSGIEKLDALLTGLSQVSRTGKTYLSIEKIDMKKLISEICSNFEFQLKSKAVDIKIGDLPQCLGGHSQLNKIFSNLLDNAIKYLKPGTKGEIIISGKSDRNRSVYCIEDNGIGLAKEYHEKIFDIFWRLEPWKGEGQGLGMAIVYKVLARLNGEIWLESQEGCGCKFFISLPADN
ncbi:PAS domain S-box protein [Candidatus Riflebacteria bacterium]